MTIDTLPAIPATYKHVLAFEVSKAELVVHTLPGADMSRIANQRPLIRRILKREIKRNARLGIGPLLVVCEATSSYDAGILACAHDLGIAVHRAHGSRVRAYARFRGKLAKSDPIDAGIIARYAIDGEDLVLHVPPRPQQQRLRELVDRRAEIIDQIETERARLEHLRQPDLRRMLEAHIRFLDRQKEEIDQALDELVDQDDRFRTASRLMQTVKGIGRLTPLALLAYLPQIGTVCRQTIAALAGLAPFDRDSGMLKGQRHIFAGRSQARTALYMPAIVAARHNPHLKDLFDRITAKGNPFKKAITAVMRKLLVILNAIVATGQPCRMQNAAREPKKA